MLLKELRIFRFPAGSDFFIVFSWLYLFTQYPPHH